MTVALGMCGLVLDSAMAGGLKYSSDDAYLKLGGRIQLQYHYTDPDSGDSSDDLLFRRLRPYIEGSLHKDWKGKWQFDLGKGKIEIKDAYAQYTGFPLATVSLGNKAFPFSREFLTSSKKQQLVERTFVGDHNYGTPDRQVGLHLAGGLIEDMLRWDLSAAMGAVDPGNSKLDFDSVASLNSGDDWIEGRMIGGRVELFPLGYFKPEQGDFKGDFRVALGAAAFTWQNDDDAMADEGENVDDVTGFEVGAALRGLGASLDAQYNSFDASLIDGEAGMHGIYKDGDTTLENYAVEGGFMVWPRTIEVVAGYQAQDADGYADEWTRTSFGLNWFLKKQDVKCQLTYRMGENKDGKAGKDVDEIFLQYQYVF